MTEAVLLIPEEYRKDIMVQLTLTLSVEDCAKLQEDLDAIEGKSHPVDSIRYALQSLRKEAESAIAGMRFRVDL